ncbi:MAG: alkaline phosphatase [Bacteroidales bacterium]|nr:alkaline phosphatase [Bacteroidales bacterium]
MRKILIYLVVILLPVIMKSCGQPEPQRDAPKNVIVFIGDGMGFNHVDAASIYLFGETGNMEFEGREWQKLAQASYPAFIRMDSVKIAAGGYNPRAVWSDTAYLRKDYTDSGAAGTALATGRKTYNGAIGMGVNADTLKNLTRFAKEKGKAAGVVTSVQISHATPAAFSAHNKSRSNYEQIARQQILQSTLDVLMGCGHPMYTNDGIIAEADFRYLGGAELWSQLDGTEPATTFMVENQQYILPDISGDGEPDAWTLITDSTKFAAIASGQNLPARLLGIPQVRSTLQQSRSGNEEIIPFQRPFTPGVPSLEQMTMAAVNVLNQNSNGFFLMVEGGAIDWAGHDNHPGRMIEEMDDFNNTIKAVVDWVEKNSSWDETLIVVTSDHETGMLWGESDGANVLTTIKNNGKGQLPAMNWFSDDHTNALVPVYIRGKGSEIFNFLADETDPVRGPFVQNTEIAQGIFLLWNR